MGSNSPARCGDRKTLWVLPVFTAPKGGSRSAFMEFWDLCNSYLMPLSVYALVMQVWSGLLSIHNVMVKNWCELKVNCEAICKSHKNTNIPERRFWCSCFVGLCEWSNVIWWANKTAISIGLVFGVSSLVLLTQLEALYFCLRWTYLSRSTLSVCACIFYTREFNICHNFGS